MPELLPKKAANAAVCLQGSELLPAGCSASVRLFAAYYSNCVLPLRRIIMTSQTMLTIPNKG